jgi:hypothetical protein
MNNKRKKKCALALINNDFTLSTMQLTYLTPIADHF